MTKKHVFQIETQWTGNRGAGTENYRAYSRDHEIRGPAKSVTLPGSSDPAFLGDASRYNPEELLVASLSSCHMLWYLHLCAEAGVPIIAYEDSAHGIMEEDDMGGGRFTHVTLHPRVIVARAEHAAAAQQLHDRAHALCFIARSVNFPVSHAGQVTVESA